MIARVPSFRRAAFGEERAHYRADIDGLRGIAVLSVVAFHAAPTTLRGGFVGVDVFFVLSGFLITTILLKGLARGDTGLSSFYTRRIKRIFPALAIVLAATAALAWFILLAGEYAALGKHMLGGATFSSNFVLQGEAGYFDVSAERKPLLHLWSLAVEEQFYLVFPLALLAARRRGLGAGAFIAVIAIGSFVLSAISPDAGTFYSPLARFWELMIGALLADRGHAHRFPFADTPRPLRERTMLSILGLLVIGTVMYTLTAKSLPVGWALAPTLGTAAVLAAGEDAWPNRRVLSTALLTWFGRISFPLYLWHWPLLSLLRIAAGAAPSGSARLVAVALSVALAWLTHVAIERPLRASRRVRVEVTVLCAALAFAGIFGLLALRSGGFPTRSVVALNPFPPAAPAVDSVEHTALGCYVPREQQGRFSYCRTDTREHPSIALLGDSKALAVFDAFVRQSDPTTRVVMMAAGGIRGLVPVLSNAPGYGNYSDLSTIASDAVDADRAIRVVALVFATRLLFGILRDDSLEELPGSTNSKIAFEGLDRMVTKLNGAGKTVVILIDNPTLPAPADCVSRATSIGFLNEALALKYRRSDCSITYDRQRELSKPYRDVLDALRAKHGDGVRLFDSLDVLCDAKRVCAATDPQGRLLYGFSDHVSDFGASVVARAIWPIFEDAVRAK